MMFGNGWQGTAAGLLHLVRVTRRHCPFQGQWPHALEMARSCTCPMHQYIRTPQGLQAFSVVETLRTMYIAAEHGNGR
jgi:hypothetical protein